MKSTKHRKKEKLIIINIVHEILLKVLQLFRTQMAATKFFILKNIILINIIILMNADPKCEFWLPPGQKMNNIK